MRKTDKTQTARRCKMLRNTFHATILKDKPVPPPWNWKLDRHEKKHMFIWVVSTPTFTAARRSVYKFCQHPHLHLTYVNTIGSPAQKKKVNSSYVSPLVLTLSLPPKYLYQQVLDLMAGIAVTFLQFLLFPLPNPIKLQLSIPKPFLRLCYGSGTHWNGCNTPAT